MRSRFAGSTLRLTVRARRSTDRYILGLIKVLAPVLPASLARSLARSTSCARARTFPPPPPPSPPPGLALGPNSALRYGLRDPALDRAVWSGKCVESQALESPSSFINCRSRTINIIIKAIA